MLEIKTYKNWKEICEAMNWATTGGNTKVRYLKQLDSICKYHKEGNKIVIDEIFAEPKEIEDKRKNSKGKEPKYYPQFLLQKEDWYKSGVYKIQFENKVYIGSTNNFRRRYIQHFSKDKECQPYVYELLKEEKHVFELLELVGEEKELEIREQYWLDKYIQLEEYEVVNQKRVKAIKPISESVNRIIRISKEEYEEAVKLLKDNGFNVL